jgi:type VI secretion system secreted protein VgrG
MGNMQEGATALMAMAGNPQHKRLLRLSFPKKDGPTAPMLANRLDATEALSSDFHYTVEVLSSDASIALKDVQGKLVSIELVREDKTLRYFSGYVFEFRHVKTDGNQATYDMVLLPWLAYLRLRRDNYLFHGKTLAEQTDEIFGDYSVKDAKLSINKGDATYTDAYQYDESDYNYLHRRWEERGWYYWYEHRKDGHTLMLCDDSTQAPPIDGDSPKIPYQREAGSIEDDAIGDWTPVRRLVSAKVSLASFDFKSPKPQQASTPTKNQQGDVLRQEVYEYTGGYGFKNSADGDAQATLRMQEIEAGGKHFEAAGNDRTVQPGRWFNLSGHFDDSLGEDGKSTEFFITEVRHSATNNYQLGGGSGGGGQQTAQYTSRLTCIRKTIPWHPGRGHNSIDPKIYGLQTALVVGPPGEEIHTDEYGRVRVQFHWDRVGGYDDKSSAWIRVATAWSGPNFGATSIPRIGTEVIVQFLDGNPDRPIITAMVPNAATMPPWDLPANKTQSGILSRSTPGGAYSNANAIRFEDKTGAEQLWLHAEKDQLTEVEHDEKKWVGNDRVKDIDRDETSHIKRDRTETVDHDEKITVHNDRTERVDHNEKVSIGDNRTEDVGKDETISIGKNRTETVGDNEDIKIGKNRTESVGDNEDIKIGGSRSVDIGGSKSETVGSTKTETVMLAKMLTVGGAYQTTVGAAMNTTVGLMQAEEVGLSKTVMVGKTFSITAGEVFEVKVGKSSLLLKEDGTIELRGIKILVDGKELVDLDGERIDLN